MNWADFVSMTLTLLAAIGGTGAIVIAISKWLSEVIAGQIEARTNSKYQVALEELKQQHVIEIERLRASIAESIQLKDRATDMLQSTYITAHSRIADAALDLWEKALEIEEYTSTFFFGYTIINPKNPEELKDERFFKLFPTARAEDMLLQIKQMTDGDNKCLPLYGQDIWTSYSAFKTFNCRMAVKTAWERPKKSVLLWYEKSPGKIDELLLSAVQDILPREQLVAAMSEIDGATQISRFLKSLLVTELEKLLTGRATLYNALREQGSYVDVATKIEAEKLREGIVSGQ
jgi:hypothetical protein